MPLFAKGVLRFAWLAIAAQGLFSWWSGYSSRFPWLPEMRCLWHTACIRKVCSAEVGATGQESCNVHDHIRGSRRR